MIEPLKKLIKDFYGREAVGLHEPHFDESEIEQLNKCIKSGFVSSVGEYVEQFENRFANYVGAKHAIAVVNGTCGLQATLMAVGVAPKEKVIVPNLTFIATSNAVRHVGGIPIFLDIEKETMGLCPERLRNFFTEHCELRNGLLYEKLSKSRIAACIPVHILGNPCLITEIADVCKKFGVVCIEDSAEALGSYVHDAHVGHHGLASIFSFNGNKVITTGGGGMIITEDSVLAKKIKHLTTTARVNFGYNFVHDDYGFNFRMPNLNAALGLAQLDKLDHFLNRKQQLKDAYVEFFNNQEIKVVNPRPGTRSNNWLIGIELSNSEEKENFLKKTNSIGISTRPLWTPMSDLEINKDGICETYPTSRFCFERIVCLPSGPY